MDCHAIQPSPERYKCEGHQRPRWKVHRSNGQDPVAADADKHDDGVYPDHYAAD